MKKIEHIVKDEVGIHARPAGQLVQVVSKFESIVELISGEKTVDAKRLMGIMTLGVKSGDSISFSITGSDENAAFDALTEFLTTNL